MTPPEKKRLCDHITGTNVPLAPAMLGLGINETLAVAREELKDTIAPCINCHRWTDIEVMEKERCMRCDAFFNPDNREKSSP